MLYSCFSVFSAICLLWPSYSLTKEVFTQPPVDFSKFNKPGNIILISDHLAPLGDLKINDKAFTAIKGHYLATTGLKQKSYKISGTSKLLKYDVPFRHPELHFFSQNFEVQHPKAKGNKLRIPSSVWSRVDDKFQQIKFQQFAEMKKIIKSPSDFAEFDPCWKWPLEEVVRVSKFGSPRRLPSGVSYLHTGLDLRAWLGTPILSPGPGKVIYTGHMIVPGKQVVIDHGSGIKSRYLHMSHIKVKTGDLVTAGQEIGRSGDTGRVEGAHLHWEVIWKGSHANPQQFLHDLELICGLE